METLSVWQKSDVSVRRYPRLTGDISVGALVIGGGIAGYLAAYRLAESGRKTVLIEGYRLFSGTTAGTTAKITYHQGNIYPKLAKNYGERFARMYYDSQCEGMSDILSLATEHDIDCGLKSVDSYVYSSENSEETQKLYGTMSDIGAKTALVRAETPAGSVLAVRAEGQYIFHPLRFLRSLPAHFDIYENTRALSVDTERKIVRTEEGSVHADVIVVATRYPIVDSYGAYIYKLRPSMSFTIAVEGASADATYLDIREDGLSVRPYDGGVTVGGFDRRTGTGDERAFLGLRAAAAHMFGSRPVETQWAAQDCVSFDGLPYVGRYAKGLKDIYVITGFGKWGMANSAVAARLIADLADGRDNAYEKLFSPLRGRKGVFLGTLRNVFRSAAYLISGNLHFPLKTARSVAPGEGKVVRLSGKKRAVYKESDGKLYAFDAMCPHKHAELRWNSETKTWDCPCHGSRFDRYGNLISAPALRSCESHSSLIGDGERKADKEKKKDGSE